tara:strand:- start:6369 stop:6749 length:381 start_codon:yes stop_codon:yes gene_type:complete
MDGNIFVELANYGSLGLFAIFLVWQYIEQKKQLKELMDGFQSKLDELREQSDLREMKLRKRYDDVIEGIQKERDELRMALLGKVNDLERNVTELDKKIDQLSMLMTDLREKILKLEIKDITKSNGK